MQITNPYIPDSYLPHLEAMNYPYFEEEWIRTRDNLAREGKEYAKYTLGKYIAKMNLKAYKPFTWEDNDSIKELVDSKPKLFFNELEKLRRTKMTTTEFLEMYDKEESFDTNTLAELWWEGLEGNYEEITPVKYGESLRWIHSESKVVQVEDRYFEIARWAGNTEYQPDEYDQQPEEVRPVEMVVRRWEKVRPW